MSLASVWLPLRHPQDDLPGRTCSQDCPAHQPARFCSIFCRFQRLRSGERLPARHAVCLLRHRQLKPELPQPERGQTSSSPIHHRCILIKARMVTCSITPPTPSHQPLLRPASPHPSGEPWEAESHHHGDLNADPPHTGPL